MNRMITAQIIAVVFAMFLLAPVVVAETDSAETVSREIGIDAEQSQTIGKLQQIKQVLADKRDELGKLQKQLRSAKDLDRAKIEEQIATLQKNIEELTQSFERIAVSGINLQNLDEAEEQELDWRDELLQIARPILNSLKDATAKPRKIEELRTAIGLYEQQLQATDKAIESTVQLDGHEMSGSVAEELVALTNSLRERHRDIEQSLEVSRIELKSLEVEDTQMFETAGNLLRNFFLGRGLTLLIALIAGIGTWLLLRAIRLLVDRWRPSTQNKVRAARFRLLLYGYHLGTIVLVAMTVLSVFYLRGDLLLLSLAIIALAMLALGAWRVLPGYILEARLLLNAGAAREGERVTYNGLPFRIASLNLYSKLQNPELEGAIRLPLSVLSQLTSRPCTDEPWYPCSAGDYLLLPNGDYGQVLQQTVEAVRLKVVGSVVQYSSSDFLQLNVRNLSREGFGVIGVFGIDYQHQEISLDAVPARFKSGLAEAFRQAGLDDELKDLLVDFKEAGTNSLDYLIFATMDGRSAASYFTIQRLIQKTCVDICNQEGWGIPFTQVTIHQAETQPD
ncbi:MAG: hypothetical protein GY806_06505 [Gammaproteobacteria bacterium]|nr:hypothetical protein [Gammaproteobacteria bacterium]